MTKAELLAFFPFNGRCTTNLGAGSYAVPTLAWLQGPFWEAYHTDLWGTNTDKWTARWACRDFARYYAAKAVRCWAVTPVISGADDGLAVGEMWFLPDAGKPASGHAVCPVFTEHGLQFIDPQTNLLCELSSAQFASRFFLRF